MLGCFSSHLYLSPLWAALEPCIKAAGFQEHDNRACDLVLTYCASGKNEELLVHVLEASTIQDEEKKILDRVASCRSNTSLVVFVKDEAEESRSMDAYMKLQALFLDPAYMSTAVVVLVPSPEMVIAYITKYIEEVQKCPPPAPAPMNLPATQPLLVGYASMRPLSQRDVEILSGSFDSIRELEEATRTVGGLRMLRERFDEGTVKSLVGFWEGEWIP